MPCYSSNTTLFAATVDDSAGVTYFASLANQSKISFTFLPPSGGSITGIACTPAGPLIGSDSIEFGSADLDISYVVTITYTTSSGGSDTSTDDHATPLVVPTKMPTFKPVTSCPP